MTPSVPPLGQVKGKVEPAQAPTRLGGHLLLEQLSSRVPLLGNVREDEDSKSQKSRELILQDSSQEDGKDAQILVPANDTAGNSPQQSLMWLGTEDGCIHVYNCNDNIRIKKNKVRLQHNAAIQCIIYLDNKVFVSLANGDLSVYKRDTAGGWDTGNPITVTLGSATAPITRMLGVQGQVWCGCQNNILVINTTSLSVEHTFPACNDTSRAIRHMTSVCFGVWVSVQNSAIIKLFHGITYECLLDVNMGPPVAKMLAACNDIIRQHKAACLRITALLCCKDLLWSDQVLGGSRPAASPPPASTTRRLPPALT
ncbi:PREDICTED: rho guanine nucleotide exchange factor 17-like [Priapulus caudatus]|uniref:Rho guanine nucleotide exchange factor 17-like n=1 Tax=Priapulus caudatus TaxID=37621 RepID=A0ABM1ELF9_PRICU|nr:PREDICTED: rho guanine nucleotide exchange factor 17-like [Priapulus caudatus]